MVKLGLYRHYKGNLYQVLSVARHSETLEPVVVYQALYGNYGIWVRPLTMFEEKITIDGKTLDRFTFLNESMSELPEIK
jgi:hypothetical protein